MQSKEVPLSACDKFLSVGKGIITYHNMNEKRYIIIQIKIKYKGAKITLFSVSFNFRDRKPIWIHPKT